MEYIVYEQKGQYGVITISREKALNALNSQVLDELNECLDAVNLDEVRALVLTGAGLKSFVAGADIGEMSSLTKAEGEAFGKKGNDVFRKLEVFPVPVIAAINGFALGGGCEIAMSCDIRICSDNAVFGQPEVGLGITPGFGGTQRLARLVGAGMATNPGVAAMFFEAMYDANVNIQMISTSEIKITVLIPRDDVDVAMKAVHDKFKMASINMRKFGADEE